MTIRILDPHIAERIAAGEVIERPASVVKELVENSIDAGATEIQIHLEDGGKGRIEVIDNGLGIPRDELALAVKRHATSKLQTLDDLEKIRTLGFRGEALPSIAAVSDFSILSRQKGGDTSYEFFARPFEPETQATPVTFGHFLNTPHGTRVRAVGLFSQVPARLKFLKSQGSEVAFVREWVERLAIAHPEIGFKLLSNDRTIINLRPATEVSRVQAILSDEDASFPILSGDSAEHDHFDFAGLTVRAHWLQGYSAPQTRKLIQVVNGRAVRDRLLQQAVLQTFKQILMPGQFPALALFVDIDPAQLDVNVHPTKTEIRFLSSRVIFDAIQRLLQSLIGKHGAPAYAEGPGTSPSPWQASDHFYNPQTSLAPQAEPFAFQTTTPHSQPDHPLAGGRFVGILFNTYLTYDLGNELALVDQHAADERIRYERLKKRVLNRSDDALQASQALLIPEAVKFEPELRAEIELRLPFLEKLGFECEVFGNDTVLFRSIPVEWTNESLKARLKSLTDRILTMEQAHFHRSALLDENLFESLAREACHSAVRAGDRLEREEAQAILEQLFACEHPWNCPHGRPTVVRIARGKIEEWFQRRV